MSYPRKLSTTLACRVARINRDRFNEHVAAGAYGCAPPTVPGRSRFFDPDDMIALWLFRELMDDGLDARNAGKIACAVADVARKTPLAPAVSYVEPFLRPGFALPADEVANPSEWDKTFYGGAEVDRVTTFNIAKKRALIADCIEEEFSRIGPDDE